MECALISNRCFGCIPTRNAGLGIMQTFLPSEAIGKIVISLCVIREFYVALRFQLLFRN